MTTKETLHPLTTQDQYIKRMYEAFDKADSPKLKKFIYNEIKMYLIKTNQWK
jgi:hypothetical protein